MKKGMLAYTLNSANFSKASAHKNIMIKTGSIIKMLDR